MKILNKNIREIGETKIAMLPFCNVKVAENKKGTIKEMLEKSTGMWVDDKCSYRKGEVIIIGCGIAFEKGEIKKITPSALFFIETGLIITATMTNTMRQGELELVCYATRDGQIVKYQQLIEIEIM